MTSCSRVRDGDILVTKHGFVFCVFGYEHPEARLVSFLKYVPASYAPLFELEWLPHKWRYGGRTLVRPRELYGPEEYREVVRVFRERFPEYVYYESDLGKWIVAVRLDSIVRAYEARESLRALMEKKTRDELEQRAVELVELLSRESRVPVENFGIRGSVAMGMHTEHSDVDLAVYGAEEYRRVLGTLRLLEEEGEVVLHRRNPYERIRLNCGSFRGARFVVNAVRREDEIPRERRRYRPLGAVEALCRVVDDRECVFRPAIYGVECLSPRLEEVEQVVSMVGLYRCIAREGSLIRVSGVLEEVRGPGGELEYSRIVVGTGRGGERMEILNLG